MNAETENKIGEALDILLEHNLITPSQALEIDEIVSEKINKENLEQRLKDVFTTQNLKVVIKDYTIETKG